MRLHQFYSLALLVSVAILSSCSPQLEPDASPPDPAHSDVPISKAGETDDVISVVENQKHGSVQVVNSEFITGDFDSAIVVHPEQILQSYLVKQLDKNGTLKRLGIDTTVLRSNSDNVEQIILLGHRGTSTGVAVSEMLGFGGPGSPSAGDRNGSGVTETRVPARTRFKTAIIHFQTPVEDKQQFLDQLWLPFAEESRLGSLSVFEVTLTHMDSVAHFPNDRTLIIAAPDDLNKMLALDSVKTLLLEELSKLKDRDDLTVIVEVDSLKPALSDIQSQVGPSIPPELSLFLDFMENANTVQVTANLTGDSLLSIGIESNSEEQVRSINSDVSKLLANLRQHYHQYKDTYLPSESTGAKKESERAADLVDQLVAGLSNYSEGNRMVLSVSTPAMFSDFPEILNSITQTPRRTPEAMSRKNKLKQIGLALHNYHDVNTRLPAAGSDFSGEKKGLSWRVHILPFVGESKLFKQFHLDEPWDSERNKELISKIPNIYQTSADMAFGKTVFQVVVGESTAFQMVKGLRFAEVIDGLSNTALVIETKPSHAEIWTKPGGLSLDENLLEEAVPEPSPTGVRVLMGDGTVRTLNNDQLKFEYLNALFTRNGRELFQ